MPAGLYPPPQAAGQICHNTAPPPPLTFFAGFSCCRLQPTRALSASVCGLQSSHPQLVHGPIQQMRKRRPASWEDTAKVTGNPWLPVESAAHGGVRLWGQRPQRVSPRPSGLEGPRGHEDTSLRREPGPSALPRSTLCRADDNDTHSGGRNDERERKWNIINR